MLRRELAQASGVGTRVVVNVALLFQPHEVRANVMRREDDPLGAELGEVIEEATVVRLDLFLIEPAVIDEL